MTSRLPLPVEANVVMIGTATYAGRHRAEDRLEPRILVWCPNPNHVPCHAARFPFDIASDQTLANADRLDATDQSREARYLREVAGSVREHRHGRSDPRTAGA